MGTSSEALPRIFEASYRAQKRPRARPDWPRVEYRVAVIARHGGTIAANEQLSIFPTAACDVGTIES